MTAHRFDGLRDFVRHLEAQGELLRVTAEVDPKFEVAEIVQRVIRQDGPALLFERVKGAGMTAGGMFNTRLEGTGWVAITTDGDPVVLRTDAPTFVDTDAVVAWSSNLQTSLNRTMKAKAAIGLGSGEAVQLTFQGDGIVIVQPSEGRIVTA